MRLKFNIVILLLLALTFTVRSEEIQLPRVEILGEEYYYYEIGKDDSIYGIARRFGWNIEELSRLNPHTISSMKKGEKLYYPVKDKVVGNVEAQNVPTVDDVSYEPISHIVKKGETVYGIAKQYGISVETIYKNHPSAQRGIKAGETIIINQGDFKDSDNHYIFYKIKSGDTLYGVAKEFGTTVKEIMMLNNGISDKNFRAGETIRIKANSNDSKKHTEIVEEERLQAVDNYKVRKDDTWKTISKRTGVDEQRLKSLNENTDKLQKDEVVSVPVTEVVEVEKEYIEQDPRSLTDSGRKELYEDVHNISDVSPDSVSIVILMDDPSSKRDLEFVRGVLVALDNMKNNSYKVNLKVIESRNTPASIVKEELESIKPNLIICTADKNFPDYVVEYGNKNMVEVLNVFDVKNDGYINNPSLVQLMTPSNYFNESVASWLKDKYKNSRLLMIGNPDVNDAIAASLLVEFDESLIDRLTIADFLDYDLNDIDSYLVYAYPTKKDDAVEVLTAVEKLTERSPLSPLVVIGRPNWITFADAIKDKLYVNDVYIPSRFYYDNEDKASKEFSGHYSSLFGQMPVKSFPMYAVTGYDVANTFIPGVIFNGGDLNKGLPVTSTLQNEYELQRVSNWGGFVNPVVFMLHYAPYKELDKIIVR